MARQRGSRWQADVRLDNGTRLRPTFTTRPQAEAWEASARLALEQGKPIPSANQEGRAGNRSLSTLGSLFEHVKRTHWAQLRSASTLTRNGKQVVDYFGANTQVSDITSVGIAEFRAAQAEKGSSNATINRKCAALSKMLHIAKDAGAIAAVPKIAKTKEEQTKFRYLDEMEEKVLIAYWTAIGDEFLADLTTLLIDTGARCFSEMMAAKWDHFGPEFASVTFWHTKSNKPRTVPLTSRSRDIIRRRAKTKGTSEGPFTGGNRDTMRARWDKMRDALGFHDVTPHTLRHTCCTKLVLGGVDIKRVMTWMGHSNVVTTMRYMQIKPTGLEDVLHILESGSSKGPDLRVVDGDGQLPRKRRRG